VQVLVRCENPGVIRDEGVNMLSFEESIRSSLIRPTQQPPVEIHAIVVPMNLLEQRIQLWGETLNAGQALSVHPIEGLPHDGQVAYASDRWLQKDNRGTRIERWFT